MGRVLPQKGVYESETLLEGLSDHKDAPTVTSIRQPKVEFAQVAHRILLVPPPSPLPICVRAQAALKSIGRRLYKSVVGLRGLKAARKVHACDLHKLEWTNKGAQGDGVTEYCGNPLTCIVGTTKKPARSLQFDRIRLVLGPWLLSRSVIDSLVLPLTCGGTPRLLCAIAVADAHLGEWSMGEFYESFGRYRKSKSLLEKLV